MIERLLILTSFSLFIGFPAIAAEPERVDFARDVAPLFARACAKCHGAEKQQGGLRFDRRKEGLGVGDSGKKGIEPGKPDASELIRRVEETDPAERMPPKADPLPREQIELLRRWIEQGATWPEDKAPAGERREMVVTDDDRQHWSYRRLGAVTVPQVADGTWSKAPVDRFLFASLAKKKLRPNGEADRRELIRRVCFDLTGLPPTPAEVDAFVVDPSPRAYEELIERLLGSRHYGERWGRHWLDVARYADSDGLESDADRPDAYQYRDFVIRSFNEDLPYDTFVRWQIAGDEYEPDDRRALAATGFLAGAPHELLAVPMEEELLRFRFNELDDIAVTTVSAFLGLTMGCARCHDHKFDAIPTRDYYRIQCAFTTTVREHVLLDTREEVAKYRAREADWSARHKAAQGKLAGWLDEQKKPHLAALRGAKINALSISEDEKKLLIEQPDSDEAKKLAKKHEKALALVDDDFRRVFSDEQKQTWDALRSDLDAITRAKPQSPPTSLALVDKKPEPEPTFLLERGDFYAKQEQLQVGFLSVLTNNRLPEEYWGDARREVAGKSTGQRRALAEWITDVEEGAGPLLARVIVNRVWQHHFGEGLVRTAGDFGVRGERPTHPELLEWLANEFVAGGWRIKSLHRLIMTSAAYRQSTAFDEARHTIDPDDRLLWRRRPQRLESEILRDAILAVSGTLNPEPFGPAFKPPIPPEAMQARNNKDPYPKDARDTPETRRRTVYMFHKRVIQHPFLQTFDAPDATVSCSRRAVTTVAPQALALLNDTFVRDRAADFARRLIGENSADFAAQVTAAFRLAFARVPTDAERVAAIAFLEGQSQRRAAAASEKLPADEVRLRALTDFCQTLFSSNEFIYVD